MTPEERFNQQVWEILQDLKEEYLAAGELIRYKKPSVIGAGIIPWKRKVNILKRLQEWGALKIILKRSKSQDYGFGFEWENISVLDIKVIQPQFDKVYKKFKKACDVTSYLNDFQDKVLSNTEKPKFSHVDQVQAKITKWLDTKEQWTLKKIWQVISALNSEWQLQDEKVFNIPHDKFERARITAPKDLEAILRNLHKQEIIRVSRKVAETPPTNDPNKPQGSLWVTITDEPKIVHKSDTLIEIFPDEFVCLRDSLKKRVAYDSKENDKTKRDKGNTKKNKEKHIQCCGLFYSFQTNQLIYSGGEKDISPETREMKFFLTLYRNKGQTVDYKTIAKEADLPSYKELSEDGEISHEQLQNKDFSEDVSLLRRDFRTLVLSLGMSADQFAKMIKTIRKQGYQIVCE